MKKVTTTCPSCGASFRVTPQQLGAGQGQVRCGQCNTLFNGLESLNMADKSQTAIVTASAPLIESDVPTASSTETFTQPPPADDVTNDSDAPVLYLPDMQPGAGKHRGRWVVGCATLALLLLGQLSFHFRDVAAREMPLLKPYLTTFCVVFGCELSLLRDANLITIESSDLKQRPDRPQEISVAALLRNRAGYAMAYPALELTLTDAADQAMVTRILQPQDYLDKRTNVSLGIAPLTEVGVNLRLELANVSAVGYRLYLFYP